MKFTTTILLVVLTTLSTAQKERNSKDVTSIEESTQSTSADDSLNTQQFGDRQWRYKRGTIFTNKGEQYRIKVIKKPGKNGKVNTIHLFPMKKEEKKNKLETTSEQRENHNVLVESDASTNVEKMMEVPKYEDESVGMESHHYEEEHKEKIKIKHHHHHHHHNHVKTVVKKEPYPVEKIVEKVVHIPVEKIVHKPFPVEKIVHVAKPYPVEKVIEKIVHVPVKEYIEKKVPYPVEKVVEKVVEKIVPKYIHIPKPYPVIKHIHVPVEVKIPVPVEKKVYIPHTIEVEKKVPYPVKVYVPQPYPVEKKIPVPVEVKFKDHHHHHPTSSHHHYSSMDDHHGYLENKFHEETAASNDQHSLTSRQSISVVNPTERYYEQMKQFQREQHQLDAQFQQSQQQQHKLNEKFKIYKKSQQQDEIHQIQMQQRQLEQQQIQHQQEQIQQHLQMQNQQQPLSPIHGLFGQKMQSDYAKPYFPSEHQHQSILTLQTHNLSDERFKPYKKAIPEFKPIANIKSLPIGHQMLGQTVLRREQQILGSSSNVEAVAVAPPDQPDKETPKFQINVSDDTEQLPKPEAYSMDAPYQFQSQPEYNMLQLFQVQPVQSETQLFPVNNL